MGKETVMRPLSWIALCTTAFLGWAASVGAQEAGQKLLTSEERQAICGARTTCAEKEVKDAGDDAQGKSLRVAIVQFGLADKPEYAPDEGCDRYNEPNGGTEYWLLRDGDKPRLILDVCNDGYGASGVGEDTVDIGDNLLTHGQYGGSAWRWDKTTRIKLLPLAVLDQTICYYNTLDGVTGDIYFTDFNSLRVRNFLKDRHWAGWVDDEQGYIGCPQLSDANVPIAPRPEDGVFSGLPVPVVFSSHDPTNLKSGESLGDCALSLSTDGKAGFIVFGKPASEKEAATLRVIAENHDTLLIQVDDPLAIGELTRAANRSSWVNLPHIEIWTGKFDTQKDEAIPQQIGVGLDGMIFAGKNAPAMKPAVKVWHPKGNHSESYVIELSWPEDGLSQGVAVVYSQAQLGRQARLVANVGVEHNQPLYLPSPQYVADIEGYDIPPATHCQVVDGILSRVPTGEAP